MVLSNAERQARYRQRLKDAATGPVLVTLNVNPASKARFNFPMRFDALPNVGDEIFTTFQGESVELVVTKRRFLDPGTNERAIVLDCDGIFPSARV